MKAKGLTFAQIMEPRGYVGIEPEHADAYLLFGQPGRDMNGGLLVSDGRAVLDENGITDRGERDYIWRMWRAMEAERAEVRREEDAARELSRPGR